MPYNYNYHRRKRLQSEYELTLAQMMQTTLNEAVGAPTGAYFNYTKDVWSKSGDTGQYLPEINVPDKNIGTFIGKDPSDPSRTLTINATTGQIRPSTSDIGTYEVRCDFGPYMEAIRNSEGEVTKPAFPGGIYITTITIDS